jgi:hypothetical protein
MNINMNFRGSMQRWLFVTFLVGPTFLQTSCGYSLINGNESWEFGDVWAPVFAEMIPAGGLAIELTRHLKRELAYGGLRFSDSKHKAKAELSGVIQNLRTLLSPSDTGLRSGLSSYRINVELKVWLREQGGRELWSTNLIVEEDLLAVSDTSAPYSSLVTEAQRQKAFSRLAMRAAKEIRDRLSWFRAGFSKGYHDG